MENNQDHQKQWDTQLNQSELPANLNKQPDLPIANKAVPQVPHFEQKNKPHQSEKQPSITGTKEEQETETTEETDGGNPAGFISKEQ